MIQQQDLQIQKNRSQSYQNNLPNQLTIGDWCFDNQIFSQQQSQGRDRLQQSSQNNLQGQIDQIQPIIIQSNNMSKVNYYNMRVNQNRSNSNDNQMSLNPKKVRDQQNNNEDTGNEQSQENMSLAFEINRQLNELKEVSNNFQQDYNKLLEVQMYMPDVSLIQENKSFVQTITHFKLLIHNLQCIPTDFLNLQDKFESILNKFMRLQSQIVQRISFHEKITYKIQEIDLGDLQKENESIVEDLENLNKDFEEYSFYIQNLTIVKYVSDINEELKEIHRTSLNKNQKNKIMEQQLNLNNLFQEKMVQMRDLYQVYQEASQKNASAQNEFFQFLQKQDEEMFNQAQGVQNDYREVSNKINQPIRNRMNDQYYECTQKLYQQKIKKIQVLDFQIQSAQQIIDKIIQEEEIANYNCEKLISKLGFQNDNQYYQFLELYQRIPLTQQFAMNIKQKYVLLIELLIDIGKMLKKNIQFSQSIFLNMKQSNTLDSILKYYQKFDKTINLAEKLESKKKILIIQDNSIIEICQEEGKEWLYQKCINNLHFSTLLGLIDKKKKEQDKIINSDIVPQIIKYDNAILQVQEKIKYLSSKILEKQGEVNEVYDDVNNSDGINDKRLKNLEPQLEILKQLIESQKEQEFILTCNYFQQNFDDIKIVKQITYTFIEAIQNASDYQKYMYTVKPYQNYASVINQIMKSFQNFKNPQLQSLNSNEFKIMN